MLRALLLLGVRRGGRQQCEALHNAAVTSCERFYQAFQFVLWAGKSPREAMDAAMFETSGEA